MTVALTTGCSGGASNASEILERARDTTAEEGAHRFGIAIDQGLEEGTARTRYRGELETPLRWVMTAVEGPAALDFAAYDGELFIRSASQTGGEWRSAGRDPGFGHRSFALPPLDDALPWVLIDTPGEDVHVLRLALDGTLDAASLPPSALAGLEFLLIDIEAAGRDAVWTLEVIVDASTFVVVERTLARFDAPGPAEPFGGDEAPVYREQVLYFDHGTALRIGVPGTIFEP